MRISLGSTANALRAERIKFTTLPSQWAAPLTALALTVGITVAVNIAYGTKDHTPGEDPTGGIYYGLAVRPRRRGLHGNPAHPGRSSTPA
ncbi:hypothetical protein ACWC9T_15715 [Kitasatospora sp. NPDC001159]